MKYRRLGTSGLKVSAVSLGAWTTYGQTVEEQQTVHDILARAIELGVNFLDNADVYARGKAEVMVGQALADLDVPRHHVVVSSKVYWPMSDVITDRGLSRKHIRESIDKSLARIGTDYLDIYYCHRYDAETPLEETVRAMDDLVHQGKILYWGTSEWSGAQIAQAVGIARQHNLYGPSVDQPGYSLVRRARVEKEVLPAARAHGIGLTTFSPLANGLLTGKYDEGVPEDSRAARNESLRTRAQGDDADRVRRLKPIADDLGISRAELALAWILRHPEVASVITGATKPEHVRSNARAADVALTEDILAQMDELFPL